MVPFGGPSNTEKLVLHPVVVIVAPKVRRWWYARQSHSRTNASPDLVNTTLTLPELDTIGHTFISITPTFLWVSNVPTQIPYQLDARWGLYLGEPGFADPNFPNADPGRWLFWDRITWTPQAAAMAWFEPGPSVDVQLTAYGAQSGPRVTYESHGQRTKQEGQALVLATWWDSTSSMEGPATLALDYGIRYLSFEAPTS